MSSIGMICRMTFTAILALSASCAVVNDDQRDDPGTQETLEATTQAEAPVAVPEDLQLITPRATCKSRGGVCTNSRLCQGSGGHVIAGSCPAGDVCCKQ